MLTKKKKKKSNLNVDCWVLFSRNVRTQAGRQYTSGDPERADSEEAGEEPDYIQVCSKEQVT